MNLMGLYQFLSRDRMGAASSLQLVSNGLREQPPSFAFNSFLVDSTGCRLLHHPGPLIFLRSGPRTESSQFQPESQSSHPAECQRLS